MLVMVTILLDGFDFTALIIIICFYSELENMAPKMYLSYQMMCQKLFYTLNNLTILRS